ncbi:hypothetical protein M885DRAFT_622435 [Pelagophyceae sp. CCMP2097]|nr:hypothetical protein M885DRAFT_622435 [Pelagophyceae sp. CCMP2097]
MMAARFVALAAAPCAAACSAVIRDDAVDEARGQRVKTLQGLVETRKQRVLVLEDLMEKRDTPCATYNVVCHAMVALAAREFGALPRQWALDDAKLLTGGRTAAEKMAHIEKFGGAEFHETALAAVEAAAAPGGRVAVVFGDVGEEDGLAPHPWLQALQKRGNVEAESLCAAQGDVITLTIEYGADGAPLQTPEDAAREAQRAAELRKIRTARGAALVVVAPPFGDGARARLDAFGGEKLIYVGEARGGLHASESFFDALDHGWTLENKVALPAWGGACPALWVLRRDAPPAAEPAPHRPWWKRILNKART